MRRLEPRRWQRTDKVKAKSRSSHLISQLSAEFVTPCLAELRLRVYLEYASDVGPGCQPRWPACFDLGVHAGEFIAIFVPDAELKWEPAVGLVPADKDGS